MSNVALSPTARCQRAYSIKTRIKIGTAGGCRPVATIGQRPLPPLILARELITYVVVNVDFVVIYLNALWIHLANGKLGVFLRLCAIPKIILIRIILIRIILILLRSLQGMALISCFARTVQRER